MRKLACLLVLVSSIATAERKMLTWQKTGGTVELTSEAAERHCTSFGTDWRLPMRRELESLLVDPAAEATTLRKDAPRVPANGFLWSGEDVSPTRKGQRWIMNLRNGHIFNGSGRTGFALCVRGAPHAAPEPAALPEDPEYLGSPTAKLTIVVAMQLDTFWFRVRPMFDHLVKKHGVRFAIYHFVTDPKRYQAGALALCAANRAGKWSELEKRINENGAKRANDPAELRVLAIDAGIPAATYDDSVKTYCPARLAQEHAALTARGVDSVPVFLIGTELVRGVVAQDVYDAAITRAMPK